MFALLGDVIHISIHAPARGATHESARVCFVNKNFNPRTREGCDAPSVTMALLISISIHAPARGATVPFLAELDLVPISIHAPARGATEGVDALRAIYAISIHAPARGATQAVEARV